MKKNNTFCKIFLLGVTFLGLTFAGPTAVEGEPAAPAGCPKCECPEETVTTFHEDITPRMMNGDDDEEVRESDGKVTISIPKDIYMGMGMSG